MTATPTPVSRPPIGRALLVLVVLLALLPGSVAHALPAAGTNQAPTISGLEPSGSFNGTSCDVITATLYIDRFTVADDMTPAGDLAVTAMITASSGGIITPLIALRPVGGGTWELCIIVGGAGSFTVTVTVSDGELTTSADAVVTYDTKLRTRDDAYEVTEGETLSVSAANGVFANDGGPPAGGVFLIGATLRQPFPSFPANLAAELFQVVIQKDGSFSFHAPDGVFGTFIYQTQILSNIQAGSSLLTITILKANDAPVIDEDTVPDDLTAEATGPGGAPVTFTPPSATDPDGVDTPTISCNPAPGATFPLGPTIVTCTADDGSGSATATDTATFVVTVEDTTPPTLTQPGDTTIEATSSAGATLAGTTLPTATDLVDGEVPVTCDPPTGAVLRLGQTTVTCSARDSAGNRAAVAFRVTVVDTTGPTVTVPDDLTADATSAAGAVVTFDAPTATDLVDGSVPVTCDASSGDTFPLGETTVTCAATDTRSNDADNASFTVTVEDTTPPMLTVPANITAEATSAAGATVRFTVSSIDLVDGPITPVCRVSVTVVTSPGAFPLGTTTVTCTATDSRGNASAAKTFTVTVADTTGPVITWVGGPQPNQTYTRSTLPGEPTCTATDAASEVTQCRVYGYSTAVGTHTLTARARDTAGNSSVSTRTYTVTGGGTSPAATPTQTPRPTATPTRPSVPTATPTRAPRPTTTPVPAQPTAIPPTTAPTQPPVPTVAPSRTPTRPPRG